VCWLSQQCDNLDTASRNTPIRFGLMKRRTVITVALFTAALAGCTPTGSAATLASPSATTASADAFQIDGVPGYTIGEFPPVPLIVIPDWSVLDASLSGFSIKVRDFFPEVEGITIRPVKCDSAGSAQTDTGTLRFYGDGSGDYTDGAITFIREWVQRLFQRQHGRTAHHCPGSYRGQHANRPVPANGNAHTDQVLRHPDHDRRLRDVRIRQ
jgi:hypothetical protein